MTDISFDIAIQNSSKLDVAQVPPAFTALLENGMPFTKQQLMGKLTILYFYPHDGTPTCTTQAINLQKNKAQLGKLGYRIIGVSTDSARKHQNFKRRCQLGFTLVSDPHLSLCEAFGVWGEKTTFGKQYSGIHRTTFILNERAEVTHRIDKVVAGDHAQQIINLLNNQ